MITLKELVAYTDELLQSARFKDYAPNGLQVEGRGEVRMVVTGVTACQALLDAALERRADVILVHHGYFWRGEPAVVTGARRRRLRTLLVNDVSLLAYHLPLDAHPELGNNAQLARRLGLEIEGPMNAEGLGVVGRLPAPTAPDALAQQLEAVLGRAPLRVGGEDRPLRRVALCTGAAQDSIEQAIALGADAFISGEISERTVHAAREGGVQYYAAGHHATERFGVQALGAHLAARFGLRHDFVEIENPV